MKFAPGQHVVCVNDDYRSEDRAWMREVPRRGGVYTVREIETRGGKGVGIRLVEIANPMIPVRRNATGEIYRMEPPFHEDRFVLAPDISEFRKLLLVEDKQTEDAALA